MDNMHKIKTLYAQIPSFTCKEGCTDCCGPVPWAKSEWEGVKDKRRATSIDCPYSLNGTCDCYEHRPFLCRLFGATVDPMMKCPHGCTPSKPLTKAQSDKLMEQYMKLMR